ncbi:MAG: ABC transporter ATP-binding protein [Candidatus Eremiobacterota bacterium]
MTHSVDVSELTMRFGSFTAVDRVSFRIRPGQIFGFLGPNGAGKSTTIRMLLGILVPTSGTGTVLGYDILTQSEVIRSHVGYMSQKFSLYEDLTVRENLLFFGGIFGIRGPKRSEELIELLRLGEYRDVLAFNLPGGVRQRLAFATALLHDPQIVFLDEPTGAVDPALRRYFWEIIVGLSQQGKTVFVTTHYMDEVERCDEICFIFGGKVIAQGSPGALKREHIRGQLFQFVPGKRLEALQALRGQPRVRQPFPAGTSVRFLYEGPGRPDEVERRLRADGLLAAPLEPVTPTLEDVFLSLVGEG